jgi:glycine/D-amino acid oxidase-like deaminating enzyme
MAGLGAARALSNHSAQVTIVDRDPAAGQVESRNGVPQGNPLHVLLPSGYRILDGYFPE